MGAKMTEAHLRILRFVAEQPAASCRVNWLPTDINFRAYRELREWGLLSEEIGRGAFTEATITPAGRSSLTGGQDDEA